jgi:hypothetical protein
MPKSGYASITIQEQIYELAKRKAEAEGSNVAALTEKAIRNYVEKVEELEEKARIIVKILSELDVRTVAVARHPPPTDP